MSMLARYRKPGGMQQLVSLLEGCLSKKREALLNTIVAEDREFGALVKAKILSPQKIFQWDPLMISEVTTRMTERALAIALKGLPPECFDKAIYAMRDLKKREVKNLYESLNPTPVEIETAFIKLVEKARELEKEGALKLDENDQPVQQTLRRAA